MYGSLLALLVAAPLAAAPGARTKDGPLYHPVKEGAKRVTEITVVDSRPTVPTETTETVTRVEERDGKYRVTVERGWNNGKNKPSTTVLEVSDVNADREVALPRSWWCVSPSPSTSACPAV